MNISTAFFNDMNKGCGILGKIEKINETILYNPVRSYFESLGFTVNSEVKNCDVTAVKGNTLIIVEMKTSLNLDVILQAVQRQRLTELVYIAVPKKSKMMYKKRWQNICHLLRRLELGLLLVTINDRHTCVEEVIEPVLFDRKKSLNSNKKRRKALLDEIHERSAEYNIGGSNRKKLLTAYRESAIRIAAVLSIYGPCKVRFIKETAGLTDKAGRILIDNHYGWFTREEHGIYSLSEKAFVELEEFRELFENYKKQYKEKTQICYQHGDNKC